MDLEQLPTPRARIRDPKNGVTFEVCAYRDITRDEAIEQIRLFMGQRGRGKLKRGSVVTILTTLR